jgi:photoactive yellow protein
MRCPWCGSEVEVGGKLCAECRHAAEQIARLTPEEYDALPYGIIELDDQGVVRAYNSTEGRRARRDAADVIGLNFFRDVAPCARVQEYEGQFRQLVNSEKSFAELSCTYPFQHGAERVHIVMLRSYRGWVLVVSKEVLGRA